MYPEEKKFKHELMKEKRRTRVLTDLVDLQSKVINQLQTLLVYQTKPLCRLGHYGCYIDHKKYNFVKPESKSSFKTETRVIDPVMKKKFHLKDKMSSSTLSKKVRSSSVRVWCTSSFKK